MRSTIAIAWIRALWTCFIGLAATSAQGQCDSIPNPAPQVADWFGYSIAVSGNVAVVGAPQDDPGDLLEAGSVYIYRSSGSAWVLERTIPNPAVSGASSDNFGQSVAVDGDVAVFGAPLAGTGVAGLSGSAYVYRYNGSTWLLQQTIPNPTPAANDNFGYSVGVSGNVMVVGAHFDDPGGVSNAGSAHVYRSNGSTWVLEQTIPNPEPAMNDLFGWSVAVSGNVAVVGVRQDNPGGVGNAGSAYVYRYNGSTWVLDIALYNPEPAVDDLFGAAVAVSGNVAVIGAYLDEPDDQLGAGSAYVYRYNGSAWLLDQTIHNPQPELLGALDNFGYAVAVSGNVAVIGAYGDDPGLVGQAGSVHVYQYNGSAWAPDQMIPNPDPGEGDYFGWSVGVSGTMAVVGVQLENPGGVPGAGSAYVFDLDGCNPPCVGDLDGGGSVSGLDLASLLGQWSGAASYVPCPRYKPEDLNHDCKVNGLDLALLLGSWGPCP